MTRKKKVYRTEILGHWVHWWVDSPAVEELPESDVEHIERVIADGCHQGELNVTYGKNNHLETSGWWSIPPWADIAMELRNALLVIRKHPTGIKSIQDMADKALERYEENHV